MSNFLFKIALAIPTVFVLCFFGFWILASDLALGIGLVSGILTILISPLYIYSFYCRVTNKKSYNLLESTGISVSLVAILLMIVSILGFINMGEGMSNIH